MACANTLGSVGRGFPELPAVCAVTVEQIERYLFRKMIRWFVPQNPTNRGVPEIYTMRVPDRGRMRNLNQPVIRYAAARKLRCRTMQYGQGYGRFFS